MAPTPNPPDSSSVLQPDLLLPEQLTEVDERRSGPSGLLWAIFLDGIQTYCRELARGNCGGLSYREAERWIFRPDSNAVTSFSTLCLVFDLDSRHLRRRLLELRDDPSRSHQILESIEQAA